MTRIQLTLAILAACIASYFYLHTWGFVVTSIIGGLWLSIMWIAAAVGDRPRG